MKKRLVPLLVASFCVLGLGCSPTADKVEPSKSAPSITDLEPAAPPTVEPAPSEPDQPSKAEAPKAPKPAPAKNDTTSAAPKETTLNSELKMIDSKEGQGEAVKTGNTISVHYTGWLYENGKRGNKFDSSVDRGKPFVFTVGQGVIRGWSEGVVGMKPGGKRELIIPSSLAYGSSGAGGVIPPNATLDFEIELLQIVR